MAFEIAAAPCCIALALFAAPRYLILCILVSVIGSIYAIFGGLKAVAVSDSVNGVGLLTGVFMIPFFALAAMSKASGGLGMADGFRFLMDNYSEMLNSVAPADSLPPAAPRPTVFTGLFFL